MIPFIREAALLLATSIITDATAQTSAPTPAAPPAPRATAAPTVTPGPTYRSVFDGYVSANEDKVVSWRAANALVGSIGGWRVYARESQQTEPTNSAPPAGGPAHEKH